jgi:hypothetical protein
MKKIFFHSNQMSLQGTEIALYDYAIGNEKTLGNKSVIIYPEKSISNNLDVINKFKKAFDVRSYVDISELDYILEKEGADLFYAIKAGHNDGVYSKNIPNMMHAVFPQKAKEIHGDAYAFVSSWLSQYCSNDKVPFVPHIVHLPSANNNLRRDLDIPEDAIVFGCHGGRDSFDIQFVKNAIAKIVRESSKHFFIFMNIAPFIESKQVKFISGTTDLLLKSEFINSCDAMIHARILGETFGLSCAEFAIKNKPIITYSRSRFKNHIYSLKESIVLYHDEETCYKALCKFNPITAMVDNSDLLVQYSEQYVMEKFNQNLIYSADKKISLPKLNFRDKMQAKFNKILNR